METQLEKKLNKLPDHLESDGIGYDLRITKSTDKVTNKDCWIIEYVYEFALLSVEHTSIQAAVDTMLSEIKKL